MNRARTAALAVSLSAAFATAAAAQIAHGQAQYNGALISDGHTRIADPKLSAGGASASFHLATPGASLAAKADIVGPTGTLKTVWTGTLTGGAAPTTIAWDGKDAAGKAVTATVNGTLENIGVYYKIFRGTWTQGTEKHDFVVTRN